MPCFNARMSAKNKPGFLTAAPNNLAVIHCRILQTDDLFGKIDVDLGLEAKWQLTYWSHQLYLDKITAQVGYASDKGEVAYKNSGTVLQGSAKRFSPIIWTKINSKNVYHASYTSSKSKVVELLYSVAFQLNHYLPQELQERFCGKQFLQLDPDNNSSDWFIKMSIL